MSDKRYFDLSIRAPVRLAMMRADFASHTARYPHCPDYVKPKTWCDVRSYSHGTWAAAFATLDQGFNGTGAARVPVWYTHAGPKFRDERDANAVCSSIRHKGWFTDRHCEERVVGIVGRLPHGRFIAGYRWTCNDERVYFPDVFTDETDAARMADEHARVFAENNQEDEGADE